MKQLHKAFFSIVAIHCLLLLLPLQSLAGEAKRSKTGVVEGTVTESIPGQSITLVTKELVPKTKVPLRYVFRIKAMPSKTIILGEDVEKVGTRIRVEYENLSMSEMDYYYMGDATRITKILGPDVFSNHGQDSCKTIPWNNMNLVALESLAACFVNLKTLPKATAHFGKVQIKGHDDSRARLESPLPNVRMLEFRLDSTSNKEAIELSEMSIHFEKPFVLSMASVKSTLGKVSELPQIHYDSQKTYQVKLQKYNQSVMLIGTNYRSEGELVQVEDIIVRRPE